jgi:hypothetical protein
MDDSNVIELKSALTTWQKKAMQCAINSKLAMLALAGRDFVTEGDAAEIVMLTKLLTQTQKTLQVTPDRSAPQTLPSTDQSAISQAAERAFSQFTTDDHLSGDASTDKYTGTND